MAEALRLQVLAALRQLLHGALLPAARARAAVWQLTPQLGAPAAAARAEAAMALDALCECAMRCRAPPSLLPHRTARCRLHHHHTSRTWPRHPTHGHGHGPGHCVHHDHRHRHRRHVSRWRESSALDVCEAGGTTQLADAMAEVYHAQQTQERRLRHTNVQIHTCTCTCTCTVVPRTPQDIARARQRSPTATYDVLREAKSGNL